MNLTYFKGQMAEELQGARDYAKLAMATRVTDPAWSQYFTEMSAAELDHAHKLFKMAEQYYTALPKEQQLGKEGIQYRCIVNMITEDGSKIRYMHDMIKNQPTVVESRQTTYTQPMPIQPVG